MGAIWRQSSWSLFPFRGGGSWEQVPHPQGGAGLARPLCGVETRRSARSASLAAPRVAAQVCAKTKGLDEESRRDLGPQPVVDIQVQIPLEGCQ